MGKEVERLRAAGMRGVQQIRVKGKDYDIDIDNYKTNKDGGERLYQWHQSVTFVLGYPLYIRLASRCAMCEPP
jgi:hypothetical protein